MKLKEYSSEEVNVVYNVVENMKDWKMVSCAGLCKRAERNKLMMDKISFQDHSLSQNSKNSILNSLENGEKPNMISMNGCHETFYMYELNSINFFANANLE